MKTCPLSYLFVLTPLFVAATGCSILKPSADLTRFYVLRAQPAANDTKALPGPALTELRVGPGRIPAYLENSKIALDAGANRVQYLDLSRWAEPLDKGLNRILSENLASRLKIQQLTVYPDPALGASAYEVRYTVERFEGELTGAVTLVASCQVVDRSRYTARAPGPALSRGLLGSRLQRTLTRAFMPPAQPVMTHILFGCGSAALGCPAATGRMLPPTRLTPAPQSDLGPKLHHHVPNMYRLAL